MANYNNTNSNNNHIVWLSFVRYDSIAGPHATATVEMATKFHLESVSIDGFILLAESVRPFPH